MQNKQKVRVRFAPSPTGLLHVGGLRTALFNYLFIKKNQGKFILRIEDTDKSREVTGAVDNIVETLKTFKLNFDEGPIFQSKRLKIYQDHIKIFLDRGVAYKCYCSAERIGKLKKQAELQKEPFRYDKHCLNNPSTRLRNGQASSGNKKFVIRQNIPEEGFTEFDDMVYGHIRIENQLLDDGILIKANGWPVYNFANVVDDHLMEISHVIRGEEFLPSTTKHILLYQASGWQLPKFVHLPLLLDKARHKLSKRTGDVAVQEYLNQGYLPEAILNFIAFLGWNPKTNQEIFSLGELVEAFDLAKVNKAGAIFDLEKLNWFNGYYLKQRHIKELVKLAKPYFLVDTRAYPEEFVEKIVKIERDRLAKLSEIGERVGYFFREPEYDKELLRWKKMTDKEIKSSLQESEKIMSNIKNQMTRDELQSIFLEAIGKRDKGEILWPLRVALTGQKASPSPFEIIEGFLSLPDGQEIILQRTRNAIAKL